MARTRSIKPKLAKNERLADMGPHAQFLFAMLPTLADREGRLEDRPRYIKAEVFPYYEVDVDGVLADLARVDDLPDGEHPFIRRYSVGGRKFIEIVKFSDHQSPHHKEESSQIPPPIEVAEQEATTSQSSINHDSGARQPEVKPQYVYKVQDKGGVGEKRFKPPSINDVTEYCSERKNTIDPQQFIDHYTSNGWKVGKNPMRDWKAAVRTWEKNGVGARAGSTATVSQSEYREVPLPVFNAHRDAGDFLTTPRVEKLPDGRHRVFGQLKSKRKIEAIMAQAKSP